MGALRGNYGNRHGSYESADGLVSSCNRGTYLLCLVSYIYFSRFGYTRPLPTAVIFVAFVMLVDFLVVALLINQSLSMFESVLGTWIPFALIFGSTFITGTIVSPSRKTSLK
jgi:hypothetical protein